MHTVFLYFAFVPIIICIICVVCWCCYCVVCCVFDLFHFHLSFNIFVDVRNEYVCMYKLILIGSNIGAWYCIHVCVCLCRLIQFQCSDVFS